MGLLVHSSFNVPPLLQRERPFVCQGQRIQSIWLRRHFPYRLGGFSSKCSVVDADSRCIILENKTSQDLISCSDILPPLTSDIFNPTSFKLLKGDNFINSYSSAFVTVEEPDALAATPAHPAGLYALYASYLAGNLVEQLWNFAWPTAVATLYPSLLPVAIVGFFAKLSVFIGAPVVGNLMDHFPRIPAYHSLNIIQTVAQLLSATMIIHALKSARCTSASAVVIQPWFVVLVVVGAIERLAGLALGVTVEREWVVLLAGIDKPVALARANAILNRIDLLTEIIGASIFGILLSKFCTVTCLKIASGLMICALPTLFILGEFINWRSSGALEDSKLSLNSDNSLGVKPLLSTGKIVQNGFKSIRKGWMEYRNLPVLPASLAYVFLYFNIALAPGSIMTAFLLHHGVSPSIIGGFSGLSAFMGVAATFISASLVEKLGILQAGAAGLVFQSLLLAAALGVFCVGSFSKQKPLFFFLVLIVLSRLGHMSYDVVGTQILQTGIPMSMANLIGTTETSIASLAEFAMLGVAIIANDVRYFGVLALLSFSSVVGAACMFCWWLRNSPNG